MTSFPEIKDILLSLSREQIDHLLIEVIYARQENESINNLRNGIKEEMRKNQNLRNEIARMEIVNQELNNNQPLILEIERLRDALKFEQVAHDEEVARNGQLVNKNSELAQAINRVVEENKSLSNKFNDNLASAKDAAKEINRLANLVTEHERLFHEQSNRLIDKDDQIFKISETNYYLERENKRYCDVTERLQKDLTIATTTITELKTQIERLENHLEDAEQAIERDDLKGHIIANLNRLITELEG